MIITQDPETGYWNKIGDKYRLSTHDPEQCEGRLCDVHNRRGPEPWASWPLNWREDRNIMEVIDPVNGVGHPTRAQFEYWNATLPYGQAFAELVHGCNGACRGLYDEE